MDLFIETVQNQSDLKRNPNSLWTPKWEWVKKRDRHAGHGELNIDALRANRKGRVPDIWLEVSLIIRADIGEKNASAKPGKT